MKIHTLRLRPGQLLKDELLAYARKNHIQAGFIITCAGAVRAITLRMAGATPEIQDLHIFDEPLEVVSLSGTVSINGMHLHIALSNKEGNVVGGHLKEGGEIFPTAEIVIGEDQTNKYTRELDVETGFNELVVKPQ